jgi:ribose 5-phosphate isomerase B
MQFKTIGIASDHAARDLKNLIADYIKLHDIKVVDFGVGSETSKSVDYPDYAAAVARDVSEGKIDGGIALCGTGIGMSITANKFPGVRATVAWDDYSARMAREHNNSNLLCLGARALNHHRAVDLVKIWLETPFAGDRHQIRLDKIREIEKKNFKPH